MDGGYTEGLYLNEIQDKVMAGLIWKQLGSADSSERWRAAHSVTLLSRFGCWSIIDNLITSINSASAPSFQAQELPFYYLHAQLWLLIAVARIAKDFPSEIAKYRNMLVPIALSLECPHVSLKQQAANAILKSLPVELNQEETELKLKLEEINHSKIEGPNEDPNISWNRPDIPKLQPDFHAEMDFDKYHSVYSR